MASTWTSEVVAAVARDSKLSEPLCTTLIPLTFHLSPESFSSYQSETIWHLLPEQLPMNSEFTSRFH